MTVETQSHADGMLLTNDRPEYPRSKKGDLYQLGEHRLLCGDACDPNAFTRLMGDKNADLLFTDPPYNVNYQGRTTIQAPMNGDHQTLSSYQALLTEAFQNVMSHLKSQASLYICYAWKSHEILKATLEKIGINIRNQIIWAKNHFSLSRGRYHHQHECIFYGHLTNQYDYWHGDRKQSTIWRVPKPHANKLHPTMKPVALIEKALRNSSQKGDIVLDPFAGSGSTLIACEKHYHKAYLIELEPRYVDIIIARWEEITSEKAKQIISTI